MNRQVARSINLLFVDGGIEAPVEVVQRFQAAEVGGLGVAFNLPLLADVEFVLTDEFEELGMAQTIGGGFLQPHVQRLDQAGEPIFYTPKEAFGRLPPRHFAIAFARMAQHHPEQMRSFALAVRQDPGALSIIHLRLGSRLYFHPHKGHRLRLSPPPHEALDGIVTADKLMFAHKVLVKTLG